jgi:hypothetical protein
MVAERFLEDILMKSPGSETLTIYLIPSISFLLRWSLSLGFRFYMPFIDRMLVRSGGLLDCFDLIF